MPSFLFSCLAAARSSHSPAHLLPQLLPFTQQHHSPAYLLPPLPKSHSSSCFRRRRHRRPPVLPAAALTPEPPPPPPPALIPCCCLGTYLQAAAVWLHGLLCVAAVFSRMWISPLLFSCSSFSRSVIWAGPLGRFNTSEVHKPCLY